MRLAADTEIKFYNAGAVQYTIGHDDATDNFVIGSANVDTAFVSVNKSGRVGIGTDSPDAELEIEMASNNSPELRLTSATVYTKLIADDTSGHSDLDFSHTLRIKEAGSEVMRIAAGNVGIGDTDPSEARGSDPLL